LPRFGVLVREVTRHGDKTPFQTLDTDRGVGQVETVLHRVEHGVFS
jgi:uncharacterized protein (DUF2384 family)